MKKTLRLILGDQLNHSHSWYQSVDSEVLYVLMEIRSETDYAKHHIQKVVAFFQAMRQFAEILRNEGHAVHYISLDDPENKQAFTENIKQLCAKHAIAHVEYQLPDEYRVDQELGMLSDIINLPVNVVDTEHFYTTRTEFS